MNETLIYKNTKIYEPHLLYTPTRRIEVTTAWKGLERILLSLIHRYNIPVKQCLEFGVEFGYSTVALSNFFKKVVGVDTFEGDIHTFHKSSHYERTQRALSRFDNIELHQSDYRDWIIKDHKQYGLIHVDIVHTYEHTYACGLWSAQHSKCTIFHDTESFAEVKQAVYDIAAATGKEFYNYPYHNGLGIIV